MMLRDFQMRYGRLAMGVHTPYDVDWSTTTLLDLPSIRATDAERARGDGDWVGEEWASSQVIPLSVRLFGQADIAVTTAARALADETVPRVGRDLWFKVPHMDAARCLLGVRVRRRAMPIAHDHDQMVRAEFDLYAPDPARYGPQMTRRAQGGGSVAGVNTGNLETWPVFELSSPEGISGPVAIFHVETGSVIGIDAQTLPGERLTIDARTGTAVVDGVIDRNFALTDRQWWAASPQSTFTVYLDAPGHVRLDVRWRSAWW